MSNFSAHDKEIYISIINKAETVFLKPHSTYSCDSIINGCMVKDPASSTYEKMYAVSNNTWRGFHRTDNSTYGSKEIFVGYFTHNKQKILSSLESTTTIDELNILEDNICKDIRSSLEYQIKANQLSSYNKIRKPVDLYIEHIVSMCSELASKRTTLTKLLFLPLDSQIFSSSYIFSRSQLYSYGIKENATFKDVQTYTIYAALQGILSKKAIDISNCTGKDFNKIYFDLLWNERYKKPGNNIFETNF